jgi:hypothetical protein
MEVSIHLLVFEGFELDYPDVKPLLERLLVLCSTLGVIIVGLWETSWAVVWLW